MRKHAAVLLAALTLALWPRPARALEISLEENRGERGSIGFVDLQAVFRRFPETLRAKQSYAEVVRQAEEQVNLKKAALMELRSELSALKVQREEAAKAPLFVAPPPPQPSTAPAAVPLSTATAPAPTPAPAVAPSTAPAKAEAPAAPPKGVAPAPALAGLPGMAAPASTEPLKINIPGLPPESLPTAATPAPSAPAVAVSSAPAALPPPPGPSAAELQAMAEASLRQRDAKVKELDAQLAAKEAAIADKEKSLGVYEGQVEKDLVDIESKRSEMLLGRIYLAVRETAVENGVSVVIDKTAILYGQGSVDLTDKVLKKLEGNQP